MKIILTCLLTSLFTASFAQNKRFIRYITFSKDSINLHMDENYFLIEDTCSSIIRYGHFRFKDRKFYGPFRDLNKLDPQIVLAVVSGAGFYKADLGSLFWEGKLLNGKPDGTWRSKIADDRTGTVMSSETHKNGSFVKGGSPVGNYSDKSRIVLVGDNLLPVTNAGISEILKVDPQHQAFSLYHIFRLPLFHFGRNRKQKRIRERKLLRKSLEMQV